MRQLTEQEVNCLAKDYHSMQRYYRMGCAEDPEEDPIHVELREQFLLIASCHKNGAIFFQSENEESIEIKIFGAVLNAYDRTMLVEDQSILNLPFFEGTRIYSVNGILIKQW